MCITHGVLLQVQSVDCMVLWCLIECGMSGQTITRNEGKRTLHRRACVVWCGVMCVLASEEEWLHGGLKKGERME